MSDAEPRVPFSLDDAGRAAFLLLGAVLVCGFLFARLPWSETTSGLAGALALEIAMGAGVFQVMARRRFSWIDSFGLQRNRLGRAAVTGLAGCALVIPLLLLVSSLWRLLLQSWGLPAEDQPAIQWLAARQDPLFLVLFFLEAALFAPVCEELFFRGLLENAVRVRFSPIAAAVFSAFLFASFHAHLPSLIPLFVLSLGFSAVYHATRSLAAAVVMHAAYNIVNFLLVLIAPPA